jgi:hypothetical protein
MHDGSQKATYIPVRRTTLDQRRTTFQQPTSEERTARTRTRKPHPNHTIMRRPFNGRRRLQHRSPHHPLAPVLETFNSGHIVVRIP